MLRLPKYLRDLGLTETKHQFLPKKWSPGGTFQVSRRLLKLELRGDLLGLSESRDIPQAPKIIPRRSLSVAIYVQGLK